MARRKTSEFPGLRLDGPLETVEEDFARGLAHWLQAGPWQLGSAGRAIPHTEGGQVFKAVISEVPIVGRLLASLIPDDRVSADEMAAALAPLSLIADVLALRDTRRDNGDFEEVLVALFADELTAAEVTELTVAVMRSAQSLLALAEDAERKALFVSLVLVYLDDAAARKHISAAVDDGRVTAGALQLETYFVSLPTAHVTTPWIKQATSNPTIDGDSLGEILDFMKHYRRERRIAEKRAGATAS